jgi:hypothetical protein
VYDCRVRWGGGCGGGVGGGGGGVWARVEMKRKRNCVYFIKNQ